MDNGHGHWTLCIRSVGKHYLPMMYPVLNTILQRIAEQKSTNSWLDPQKHLVLTTFFVVDSRSNAFVAS